MKTDTPKILSSQADLDPKDRPMPAMFEWCQKQQGTIVVLKSGIILSSQMASRAVQNCKVVMLSKGLKPAKVLAATGELIAVLLANADSESKAEELSYEDISVQQRRLRVLVKDAIHAKASDIHIEVRAEVAHVWFRQYGELRLHAEWLPRFGREIASVAFNKETDHATTHFNPWIPQNASMPLEVDGVEVRLRLASLPAHGGFDMVLRLLTTGEEQAPTLDQLGYAPEHISIIEKAIQMPHGAIIVAGPTGSGKTTTLASCMQMVNRERKVYTIEDPVEKLIPNATQVPVNTERGDRDFATMGRAALRMDPDIIILGEIRDEETASVMMRASITGHLVLSTLHTNTAPTIATRLVDMGISSSLLSDSQVLVCLICQRLVIKLCPHCAMPIAQSKSHQPHMARWREIFGHKVEEFRVRAEEMNCATCKGSGVEGRTVIAEVIWIDESSREYIQRADTLGWENYLKGQSWKTHRDHAMHLVEQGVCDPLDVEKVIGEMHRTFESKHFDYQTIGR
ncbi:MAG: GspE/PulE family protein [Gammaproteobacteria bacterium]